MSGDTSPQPTGTGDAPATPRTDAHAGEPTVHDVAPDGEPTFRHTAPDGKPASRFTSDEEPANRLTSDEEPANRHDTRDGHRPIHHAAADDRPANHRAAPDDRPANHRVPLADEPEAPLAGEPEAPLATTDAQPANDRVPSASEPAVPLATADAQPANHHARPVKGRLTSNGESESGAGSLGVWWCVACGGRDGVVEGWCRCGGRELRVEEVAGDGVVHTFTVVHRSFADGYRGREPYVAAWVDLDGGVRAFGHVVGCAPDDVRVGMPVRVTFIDELPHWRPA